MNKAYFFVKPSSFVRLGDINIDGEFEYVNCKDFEVNNPKENYMIFEVRYVDYVDGREYETTCRELVSRRRFNVDVETRINHKTNERKTTVILGSDEIGLYSDVLPLEDILVRPSRAAGLLDHFQSKPSNKRNYCKCLKEMVEEAEAFKHIYDTSIDGPSRYLVSQMKKSYKKTRV